MVALYVWMLQNVKHAHSADWHSRPRLEHRQAHHGRHGPTGTPWCTANPVGTTRRAADIPRTTGRQRDEPGIAEQAAQGATRARDRRPLGCGLSPDRAWSVVGVRAEPAAGLGEAVGAHC